MRGGTKEKITLFPPYKEDAGEGASQEITGRILRRFGGVFI